MRHLFAVLAVLAATLARSAAPTADSFMPNQGVGASQTFVFHFSSSNGYTYLNSVYVRFTPTLSYATPDCDISYTLSTNQVYLTDDSIPTGPQPMSTMGTSGSLSNNQCTLNVGASSASGSGNTLTLTLVTTFTGAFDEAVNVYGAAVDNSQVSSGFKQLGKWTIPPPTWPAGYPAVESYDETSGAGTSGVFQVAYDGGPAQVNLLMNSTLSTANACDVEYHSATNQLYLHDDAGTGLLGPLTPGGTGAVHNSQCTLNAAGSYTNSGATQYLFASLAFKSVFIGEKSVYGSAENSGGQNTGWVLLGSWNTAAPPSVYSESPNGGAGMSHTFTFEYSSKYGYQYLDTVYGLIGSNVSVHSCRVQYVVASNRLYLANDGNPVLGPATPGQAGTLSSSECSVDVGASSVSGSGDILSLTVAVTFQPSFAGGKNIYGYAIDNRGLNSGWQTPLNSGWRLLGDWNVANPQNLKAVYMLINASRTSVNGCELEYQQASNRLYLMNDAGTAWLGPLTTSLSNSQCTVQAPQSSASGNSLDVTLILFFQPAFAGLKNLYGEAVDYSNLTSGWQTLGSWDTAPIQSVNPTVDSVTPNAGGGVAQSFTFRFSSVNSYGYLRLVRALFGVENDGN